MYQQLLLLREAIDVRYVRMNIMATSKKVTPIDYTQAVRIGLTSLIRTRSLASSI